MAYILDIFVFILQVCLRALTRSSIRTSCFYSVLVCELIQVALVLKRIHANVIFMMSPSISLLNSYVCAFCIRNVYLVS